MHVGRPVITIPPVGLDNVAAGAKVTFGCIAEGSPPPLIRWMISPDVTIVSDSKLLHTFK